MNIKGRCTVCHWVFEMKGEDALMLIEGEEVRCRNRYVCDGILSFCTEEGKLLRHTKDLVMRWEAETVLGAYIIRMLLERFVMDSRLLHDSDMAGSVIVIRAVNQEECVVEVGAEVFVEVD